MNRKIRIFSFLAFFLIFSFLFFYKLASQDMEVVELLTSDVARRNWLALLTNRLRMGHPPLYFFMIKLWMLFFDHNQINFFAFSYLLGAAGLPLIYLLARELGSGKYALLAPLFWSLHPSVIYYSRYARPQIGVAVLCIVFLIVLLKNFEKPQFKNIPILIFLGAIGALWSHLFIFFWLGIFLSSLILFRKRPLEHWILVIGAIVSQVIMAFIVQLYSSSIGDRLEWIKAPNFYEIVVTLLRAFGAETGKINLYSFPIVTPILGIISVISVFFWSLKVRCSKWAFLIFSSLVSIGLLLLMTLTLQPMWFPRYLVFLLPVIIVCLSKLVEICNKNYLAVLLICLICISSVVNSYNMLDKRQFGLASMVEQLEGRFNSKNDAVIVLSVMTREALRLYSTAEFKPLVLRSSFDQNKSFKLIRKHIKNKKRLWVLEFPRKDSIIKMKEWKKQQKNKFYDKHTSKIGMYGYAL